VVISETGAEDQAADGGLKRARPPVKREYKATFFEVGDVFGIPLKLFT
jgi:hypothetical protein